MAGGPRVSSVVEHVPPKPADRLVRPFQRFARFEAAGGLVLLAATIAALLYVNLGGAAAYDAFIQETKLTIGAGDWALEKSLGHFINDGLMALFFLLVGLEMKREILTGELNSLRRAAMPIAAALGGMVVPAGIYAAINWGEPTIRGWGVPMATDIAFALGVMALLGRRVPLALRVFLTSLAIVDDLGALIVIAVFYTESLSMIHIWWSLGLLVLLGFLGPMGVRSPVPYLLVGAVLWYLVLKSGIHATIAGVALAAVIPARPRVSVEPFKQATNRALRFFEEQPPGPDGHATATQGAAALAVRENCRHVVSPLARMEHSLIPLVAFLIVPIFAAANAGVALDAGAVESISSPIAVGIALGLLLGKPVGVVLFSWLAVKSGLAELPKGAGWQHVVGAGLLSGIGFTMALFIANLGFADRADLDAAKVAILGASAVAGVAGLAVLATARAPQASGVE